jgi:hypothetical protein
MTESRIISIIAQFGSSRQIMWRRLLNPGQLSGEESSAGHVEYGIRTRIAAIEDRDRVFSRKN